MLCGVIETTVEIDEKLEKFYSLHVECGINLTSIKEKEEFYLKHYADSVYYFHKYLKPAGKLADIGSGGGFPGMVLGIFYPNLSVSLVESVGKKCDFLEKAVEAMNLKNVSIIRERAENLKGCKFDIITARGVASVKEILKKTWGLSISQTKWILYKGEKAEAELKEAEPLIKKKEAAVVTLRIESPFTRTYCVIAR